MVRLILSFPWSLYLFVLFSIGYLICRASRINTSLLVHMPKSGSVSCLLLWALVRSRPEPRDFPFQKYTHEPGRIAPLWYMMIASDGKAHRYFPKKSSCNFLMERCMHVNSSNYCIMSSLVVGTVPARNPYAPLQYEGFFYPSEDGGGVQSMGHKHWYGLCCALVCMLNCLYWAGREWCAGITVQSRAGCGC